jgi:hypothetical protein
MILPTLCQSCGIPLDTEQLKGTKTNGLKTDEYCKFCYDAGSFVEPTMTFNNMKETVETQMKKLQLSEHLIQDAVNILPTLNRWKTI